MQVFHSLLRPDESAGRAMRCAHRLWVFFWLTVFGLGVGLLSLYLTAHACPGIDAQALWASYFKLPLLAAMNLLMPRLFPFCASVGGVPSLGGAVPRACACKLL